MKTEKTNEATAAPSPKDKVKIKNLKLNKETIQNLSDQDATAVRGGVYVARSSGGGGTGT